MLGFQMIFPLLPSIIAVRFMLCLLLKLFVWRCAGVRGRWDGDTGPRVPVSEKVARTGYRMGDAKLIDAVVQDGLWCSP